METEVAALPAKDGVACFTRLYLSVTESVQQQLTGFAFRDPRFLARLDVVFADLFFSALDAARADPARLPRAWAPLVDGRSRRGIAPLQFALAGMSAHINRDLPVALVATCRELGIGLEEGSGQHADFVHVNGVLAHGRGVGQVAVCDRLAAHARPPRPPRPPDRRRDRDVERRARA